ncbi:DUF3857 domain-containing protein [Bizionia arctica]|uniref:DUF3857 domain-containing protein n=1 Tax=Bizionia arctica TaxID=1495645 RepID=A0A917GAG2_9FLAO|nr:DUF3857 domain-containing protein [Bizionia arctica]GGG32774.1 hypothetical protein GCM10010976_00720 [Bizionia arctica]
MKYVFLFALVLTLQITVAQDYKFGKISKEELEEKQHQLEPNANAAILYSSQKISFNFEQDKGFVQYNEIHQRIKIYNKEGYEYATKKVRLYDESSDTKDALTGFKAYTYNLVEGDIDDTKLSKDGIFEEKTSSYWRQTKFTMPNIKDGSIIEFRYTIVSPRLAIEDIPFQELIPINKIDFRVETPEYFRYSTLLNSKASYYPKLNESQYYKNVSFSYRKLPEPGMRGTSKSELVSFKRDVQFNVVESNSVNIPSLVDEIYVDNLSNYQARLIMELSSIQYPDTPYENLSTTWEVVTKTIYESSYFGDQLNKTGYFGDDLSTATAGATNPEEQIYNVFNFVKTKVKWNGIHSYYTDLGVRQAYKQGVGNVADINLILIAMLRDAGLDANPVLVSTKDNGIPVFPTRNGFNYVICAVNSGQSIILLDASKSFTSLNVLPVKVLNWRGRLVRNDGSSDWIDLSVQKASKEVISLNIKLNTDLSATGKIRNQYTDYKALEYRNSFESFSQDDLIKDIESKNGNLLVSNIEVSDMKTPVKPVQVSYEYELDDALEEIGENYYFSPLLFLKLKESPFKLQTRNYPIDLNFPTSRKYMVNILLPEGFEVESLPANEKLQYNNTEGEFTYLIKENGAMLQLVITLDLNNTLILPPNYEQFKQFFELLVNKQAEKIILRKV